MTQQAYSTSRAWSWRHAIALSDLPAMTRHMLLTLSLKMDETGGSCYPPISELVTMTGLDKKTVLKHLDIAEQRGWLEISQHGFRGQKWKRNEYFAKWPGRDVSGNLIDSTKPDSDEGGGNPPPPSEVGKAVEMAPEGGGNGSIKVVEQLHQDKILPTNIPSNSPAREHVNDGLEEDRPGTAAFQKRVQRLIHGGGYSEGEWPNWNTASPGWYERLFAKLTTDERKEAEVGRDPMLAKARRADKTPMVIGNYLRDKAWTLLSDADRKWSRELAARKEGGKAGAGKPEGWAPVYGPAHAAEPFRILVAGPERPKAAPQSGPWLANHIRTAWPRLFAFRQATAIHGGMVLANSDHIAGAMEFVPADSQLMTEWQEEFRRQHWPDMPVLDGMRGLYLPRGGPDGLEAFKRRVEGDADAA